MWQGIKLKNDLGYSIFETVGPIVLGGGSLERSLSRELDDAGSSLPRKLRLIIIVRGNLHGNHMFIRSSLTSFVRTQKDKNQILCNSE